MVIGRRPQPVIGKLAGVLGSGKSKGLKKYDLGGGVGLGIVAALEKTELVSHNHKPNKPIFITRNQTRPIHVPMEVEKNEEDYTFVTCHGPNKTKISTKVYYDGGQHYGDVKKTENVVFDKKNEKNFGCCVFYISPARISDDFSDLPESDFLSCCQLCHKKLHGKDIYMYRGEKAFCSTECRFVQIAKDERREKKLISEVASSRSTTNSADISTTPYDTTTNGLVFATGILAT